MNLTEKINNYLSEGQLNEDVFNLKVNAKSGGERVMITLPISAKDEDEARKKFKDMIDRHIKNGHLPKDTKFISDIEMD